MADATDSNGEFSDAQTVDITEDESSSKISGLRQNITDLEQENVVNLEKNEGHRKQVEELKALIEELKNKNVEIKKQLDKAESENRALGSVAAQAAGLEGEVSRLQHDLASAESDLLETGIELEGTRKDLEEVKGRDKGKYEELAALGKERDLLLTEVEELEGSLSSLRDKLEGLEKEKSDLKKRIEELEAAVEVNKGLEELKDTLERTTVELKGQIRTLKNRDMLIDDENKGDLEKNSKMNWALIGGSTLAAVAAMWVACCVRAARKH